MRVVAVAAALVAALGWAAAPSSGTTADDHDLQAIVGTNDGFDIGLFFLDGRRVSTLDPGTYTIVVHDRSAIHNFHLASNTDSTVDFRTDIPFVGDQTFTVTFHANTRYAYACEPHWQVMNGEFFVTSGVGTTPAPPVTPTVRVQLTAAGAVKLAPAAVAAGKVRIVVTDRSTRFGLKLAGRRTSASFTGTATWTLRLAAGTYRATGAPGKAAGILRAR